MLAVYIVYHDDLVFSPELCINELFKAVTGLIPIIFGFLLINYYWSRRTSDHLITRSIAQLITSTEKIIQSSYLLGEKNRIEPHDQETYSQNQKSIANDLYTIKEEFLRLDCMIKNISPSVDPEFFTTVTPCLSTIRENLELLSGINLDRNDNDKDIFTRNQFLGEAAEELCHYLYTIN